MIIKPEIGGRIFWGLAGATLAITACAGLTVPMPGILLTCLGLPLAVFSFGYAFGAAQTRIDESGVFQRNFFFMSKQFAWSEIESGSIQTATYDHKDSSGWTSRRTRTYMSFTSGGKKIYINAKSSGSENWWHDLRKMAEEKLEDKFDG